MKTEVKLESAAEFREAIGVLAAASEDQRVEIAKLGELVKGAEARIQLLMALVDAHHEIFIKHGWAKARPVEKTPQVN